MSSKTLSARQKRFVEAYEGNGAAAARSAGYSGTVQALSTQAARLLKNAEVRGAIAAREGVRSAGVIASREARQQFWTEVMLDESMEMGVRLRASELLARSEGDFLDRVEHGGNLTIIVEDPFSRQGEASTRRSDQPSKSSATSTRRGA